jgi:hypothetical protein
LRYVSFSNAQGGSGGHRYSNDGLTAESRLFGRLFRSEPSCSPASRSAKA